MKEERIQVHRCYSNGIIGSRWAVWRVASIIDTEEGLVVSYKVVAGQHRRKSFSLSLEEFAASVRYEVAQTENEWSKVVRS